MVSCSDIKLNEDPYLNLSSVGQYLMIVFGWTHRVSASDFLQPWLPVG